MLGGVGEPAITVARALELFWSLAADRALGKSEDQLRRWKNPRKKAIVNFVDLIGDKAIGDITVDDRIDFRQGWLDKITADGLTPSSANKDLVHLADTLRTVNRMKRPIPIPRYRGHEGHPHRSTRRFPGLRNARLVARPSGKARLDLALSAPRRALTDSG